MQLKKKTANNVVVVIRNVLTLVDKRHVQQVPELVLDMVVGRVRVHTINRRKKIINQ